MSVLYQKDWLGTTPSTIPVDSTPAYRAGLVVGRPVVGMERRWRIAIRQVSLVAHSHSMVPGDLLVTSRTTRLTSGTSLVIRVEILASTS
jgi:hypothetical protein